MKTFELDPKLQPRRSKWDIAESEERLSEHTFLFPTSGADVHAVDGFIPYACFCYMQHYSMVMSPTDVMYMVQCELALAIKSNPDAFASMFTKTPGKKQWVVTVTGHPDEINVFAVKDALKHVVPTNVDLFLPEFSTDVFASTIASHVAFCDIVSPYYNYGTLLCGIPRVEIAGTLEDWQDLATTLYNLSALFQGNLKEYLARIWNRVLKIVEECRTGSGDMFKQMVSMKRCGSGSDQEVTGWILEFMNISKSKSKMVMLKNIHQHLSQMAYTNLDTQRSFRLFTGIFFADLRGDAAIPQYNAFRIETTNARTSEDKKI
jgi:hypothetical protein